MKTKNLKVRWRRFSQFSVKALLLLVAAVAVACGWFTWKLDHKRRERAAVAEIQKIGGHVIYRWQQEATNAKAMPPGPQWLRRRLGDDFFSDVVGIAVHGDSVTDEWLAHLEPISELTRAHFLGTRITNEGVRYLSRFKTLEEFNLDSTATDAGLKWLNDLPALKRLVLSGARRVSDAGMTHLAGLSELEQLWLDGTSVTDAGLAHLKGLSNLKELWLRETVVGDAGLSHLKGLKELRTLNLDATAVTDAGLVELHTLSALQDLWVQGTRVTPSGRDAFRRALPKCRMHMNSRKWPFPRPWEH